MAKRFLTIVAAIGMVFAVLLCGSGCGRVLRTEKSEERKDGGRTAAGEAGLNQSPFLLYFPDGSLVPRRVFKRKHGGIRQTKSSPASLQGCFLFAIQILGSALYSVCKISCALWLLGNMK